MKNGLKIKMKNSKANSNSTQLKQKIGVETGSTSVELSRRRRFHNIFTESPIGEDEILNNLGLYIRRQNLARILFLSEVYKMILNTPGVVMEFGVRWGQNMALFSNLRGMYEPFNHHRKIVGFDTFSGFPKINAKDGDAPGMEVSTYAVSDGYKDYLAEILKYHESESPISHKQKFQLIQGDACKALPLYLLEHPEITVALAYFDFDIYEPTLMCLKAILPRLTKGSVVCFDELNQNSFPGETIAFQEVVGSSNVRLRRMTFAADPSYYIVE
jgi:hypothetical protein